MPSSVDPVYISNLALSHVTGRTSITSMTENTRAANLCNMHFWQAAEECLEEGDFSWSHRRATLAAATLTTYPNGVNVSATEKGPWAYGYRLPSDCLIPLSIDTGIANPPADLRIPFSVELLDGVEVLYTNLTPAVLIYTARITDTSLFSRKFAKVISFKLAALIAGPLTGKEALAEKMEKKGRAAMDDALAHDYRRDQPDQTPDPDWIRESGRALPGGYYSE